MAIPAWRKIGEGPVPARPGVAWTALVENVTPGKIIKIEVPRTGPLTQADAARAAAARAEAQAAKDAAAQVAADKAAALTHARETLNGAEKGRREIAANRRQQKATQPELEAAEATLTDATTKLREAAQALEEADAASAWAAAKVSEVDALQAADQVWTPKTAGQCTADGKRSPQPPGSDKFVVTGAPCGCLIARFGGSSVDMAPDGAAPPARIIVSVGRLCVLVLPDSVKGGPIFLAANDIPDSLEAVSGQLQVNIYEAL